MLPSWEERTIPSQPGYLVLAVKVSLRCTLPLGGAGMVVSVPSSGELPGTVISSGISTIKTSSTASPFWFLTVPINPLALWVAPLGFL